MSKISVWINNKIFKGPEGYSLCGSLYEQSNIRDKKIFSLGVSLIDTLNYLFTGKDYHCYTSWVKSVNRNKVKE